MTNTCSYISNGPDAVSLYSINNAYNYNGNNGTLNNNNRNNTNGGRPFSDSSQLQPPSWFIQLMIDAYRITRKGKMGAASTVRYDITFEKNLLHLAYDVWNFQYIPRRSIAFIIFEPKQREVEAAHFSDRIVQALYVQELGAILDRNMRPNQCAARVGYGGIEAIRQLQDAVCEATNNYTEEAYVGKIDITGFFMNIDKAIMTDKLVGIIQREYDGPLKDHLIYLTRILFNYMPCEGAVRKSPLYFWNGLPDKKSLMKSDWRKGLAIGNWHVHIGANIYVEPLIAYIEDELRLGRVINYTDDFVIVCKSKEMFWRCLPLIRKFAAETLHLEINPQKVYLQSAYKPVKFIGYCNHGERLYTSKRTVHKAFETLRLSLLFGGDDDIWYRKMLTHYWSSFNSYLGFMRHTRSYNIRKRFCTKVMESKWGNYLTVDDEFTTFKIYYKYNTKEQLLWNVRQFRRVLTH